MGIKQRLCMEILHRLVAHAGREPHMHRVDPPWAQIRLTCAQPTLSLDQAVELQGSPRLLQVTQSLAPCALSQAAPGSPSRPASATHSLLVQGRLLCMPWMLLTCCQWLPLSSRLAMMRVSHLTLRAPVTPGTTTRRGKPWSTGRALHCTCCSGRRALSTHAAD